MQFQDKIPLWYLALCFVLTLALGAVIYRAVDAYMYVNECDCAKPLRLDVWIEHRGLVMRGN